MAAVWGLEVVDSASVVCLGGQSEREEGVTVEVERASVVMVVVMVVVEVGEDCPASLMALWVGVDLAMGTLVVAMVAAKETAGWLVPEEARLVDAGERRSRSSGCAGCTGVRRRRRCRDDIRRLLGRQSSPG